MSTTTATSYDEIPYASHAHRSTHPDQLATMAAMFGMQPAAVETCRVVELGCAAGGNLLPMAASLPRASFLGCDLSAAQIDQARAIAKAAGLDNVRLEQCDLATLGDLAEPIDYLICHGVFSWVPRPVQQRIFEICQRHLAPHGIAYISYNTYPGWHVRMGVRDMMLYHAGRVADPRQRIPESLALLDFLIEAAPEPDSPYVAILREEQKRIRARDQSYLFHEHLEECNEPVYFYQFMERAHAAGLQFLSEATVGEMLADFPPKVQETLRKVAPDLVAAEQYMDFLRNRMFRRTLLCRAEVQLNRNIDPAQLRSFFVSGQFNEPEPSLELTPSGQWSFKHATNALVTLSSPLQSAALCRVAKAWPQAVQLEELTIEAREDCGAAGCPVGPIEADLRSMGEMAFKCVGAEVVELRRDPIRFCVEVSERPKVTGLARYQAALGDRVVNQRHEVNQLMPFDRALVSLLDGTRTKSMLREELTSCVMRGGLKIEQNGRRLCQREHVEMALDLLIDDRLSQLARKAMLVC